MVRDSQKGFAMPLVIVIVALLAVVGGVSYFAARQESSRDEDVMKKDEAMMDKEDDAMMEKEEGAMMQKGSYEAYSPEKLSLAESGDVVLFFRASWCPTCRALDADIRANADKIPHGVVILDVNYDTATALKQKYGVTYQHTFVQVDAGGKQITKWTSSPTLSSLLANIK